MMDKLYYIRVDEIINQDVFNYLLSFLSKQKQEKVNQLYFDIDKKLSLFAEIIVRILVCKKLNINNTKIVFNKGRYGKPHIKGYPNFHYNISHTRNAIAIALSDNSIGVDIEKVGKAQLKIATLFFTTIEQEYINEAFSKADIRFYEVWTKKEAYIKYIGKGLSMPLNSFNTLDKTISEKIQSFNKDEYIISICSELLDKSYKIVEFTESQVEVKAREWLK